MLRKLNNYTITSNVTSCIHQAFVQQAIMHPNKLAVTLDDQSLTYNELLARVQQLTFILINDKGVRPGDIVCQYVDRSIEMIVGIMSIMMSGAVYAPLNTSDPIDRLELLVHQVDAKLILVNQMSCSGVSSLNVPIVDISEVVESYGSLNDAQIQQLSQVALTSDSISHIVFTSGSTGTPKAVQIRHRNFMAFMQTHIMQMNDIVLQLTSSSFDAHLEEIDGALVRGAQLVVLKTGGHFDFDYVTQTIHDKKVTYVGPVPSWLNALGKFLNENHHAQERVKSVSCWSLAGEKQGKRKKELNA
jgi:non-ribosomal peptide synthetase component F